MHSLKIKTTTDKVRVPFIESGISHVLSYLSRLINAFAISVVNYYFTECFAGCVLFTNSVVNDFIITLMKRVINKSLLILVFIGVVRIS